MLLRKCIPRTQKIFNTRSTPILSLLTGTSLTGSASYFRPYTSKMAKPKVYITRQINQEAIKLLETRLVLLKIIRICKILCIRVLSMSNVNVNSCEVSIWPGAAPVPKAELVKNLWDTSALFCMLTDKIDKEVLENAPNLRVIATMSVGYDHLSISEIKAKNIKIGYTPDILTDATAELTVALLLATSRRLLEASEEARTGGWQAWSPFWMCGPGLGGSVVGIVGFGRIGQEVAKRLKPFNVKKILFQNRSERAKEAQEIGATRVSFDELLKESDFVIVTCALTPETRGLFGDSAFEKMKPTAVFVNTSRGTVVDQDALIRALENKTIFAAGLDVMTPEPLPRDSPLFKLKNCVILPHIGSAAIETRNGMAILTARNILTALNGEQMPAELVV